MTQTEHSRPPQAAWGRHEAVVREWIDTADRQGLFKRIWDKDATLWKKEPAAHKEIRARLGWLTAPSLTRRVLPEILRFTEGVREAGFRHVVLLGMGGSSLAPEVIRSVWGPREGYPELWVLDSTDPARVKDVEAALELEHTLFIVSSKSGGTIELLSLFKYFHDRVRATRPDKAGDQFIAITDPGTPLEALARQHNFRHVFFAPEDVGGRFSALTVFGIVPAALTGADVQALLGSAEAMAEACSPNVETQDNAAAALGIGMAVLAEEGRDKLTILAPPALEAFGDWAEQLVAESTGKEGSGIVPVVREAVGAPASYGADRFFVALVPEWARDEAFETALDALAKAGHPVLRFHLRAPADLGGEFFRWEMATAVASALLKINAFDQPDVQAAKDSTKEILKRFEATGRVELKDSSITMEAFWENAEEGDYVAVLAFLPDRPALRAALAALREEIRRHTRLAVTTGLGPRYLHSTGQLHKGGPNKAVFLLVTAPPDGDLPVPGEKYTFGQLETAQAMGDFEALESRGRWLLHVRLGGASEKDLRGLLVATRQALGKGAGGTS